MFDYSKIRDQVTDYLTEEFEQDFDIDGIMSDLRDIEPEISDIDDVDHDDFIDIINRNDNRPERHVIM